jgi:methylmalonyl-CoA mutase N-terminal domain/subunit
MSENTIKDFERVEKAFQQRSSSTSPLLEKELNEVYGPEDLEGLDYLRDIGRPGEYPFTRGIHPRSYRQKFWTMRELTGYGTTSDTSTRLAYLARQGVSGLNVIADVPTYLGIDSDHPLASEQVGREGTPLCSLADMEDLLKVIPLDRVSTSLVISSSPSAILLAQVIAVARKRGIALNKVRGTIQNEPLLGRYRGYEPSTRHIDVCMPGDVIEYCVNNLPRWTPSNVNFAIPQCWGVSIPFEVAVGLSVALAHLEEAIRRGLDIDVVAAKISFFTCSDVRLFEEAARIRATRRLWARLMKTRFNAKTPQAMKFVVGAAPAGFPLYPQEVENNIIRLCLQTLAMVLGGVQSIFVPGYDEPVSLPTEKSHRLSLRIQQILAYETGVASVADPLGGSYYVEWLTNTIEEDALKILQELDEVGGIISAIESKWLDSKLEQAAFKYQNDIRTEKIVKVGVNFGQTEDQEIIEVHRIPARAKEEQLRRMKRVRANRNSESVRQHLLKLRRHAGGNKDQNLMPYIIECVEAYATIGEIFGTINQAFGNAYDPLGIIDSPFEE